MGTDATPELFITGEQVCEILAIGRDALRGLRAMGMPHYPISGTKRPTIRYRRSEVNAWMRGRRVISKQVEPEPTGSASKATGVASAGSDYETRMKQIRRCRPRVV